MLKKRKEIISLYKACEIKSKKMIVVALTALIMSLIIMCGPIVFFINLYIFNSIRYFATFMVATFIALIYLLFNIFYYKGLTEGKVKQLYYIYLPYNFIVTIIIYIIYAYFRIRGIL